MRLERGARYVHRDSGRVGVLVATRIALSGAMRLVVRTDRADIEAAPEAFERACSTCGGLGFTGEDDPCFCGGRGW